MLKTLFLLCSFALLPAALGLNCPVKWEKESGHREKGTIDVAVDADTTSNWPGWKVKMTFDQNVRFINLAKGKDTKCSDKTCSFVTRNWVNKQAKLEDLGFQVRYRGRSAINVVNIEIAKKRE